MRLLARGLIKTGRFLAKVGYAFGGLLILALAACAVIAIFDNSFPEPFDSTHTVGFWTLAWQTGLMLLGFFVLTRFGSLIAFVGFRMLPLEEQDAILTAMVDDDAEPSRLP